MLLHADAAELVGKGKVLAKTGPAQLFQLVPRYAVTFQLPQKGADEAVARTGGVHSPDFPAGGKAMGGAGVGVGTAAAAGVDHQLHITHEQLRQGGFDVRRAGEKFQLFIRNFEDVGKRQELQHRPAQHVAVRPEREAQVRVKADDAAGLPGGGDGRKVGVAHGTVHQRDTAEVQGKGIGEPCRVDLLRRIEQVRRGLAVEAEGAAAVLFQTDEGKGRAGLIGKGQMGEVDAAGFQFPGDLVAEGVVAQLAQKSTFAAQPGKGRAHVGRCAASARAERGDLVKRTAHPGRDHIDECFANGKQCAAGHREPPKLRCW